MARPHQVDLVGNRVIGQNIFRPLALLVVNSGQPHLSRRNAPDSGCEIGLEPVPDVVLELT